MAAGQTATTPDSTIVHELLVASTDRPAIAELVSELFSDRPPANSELLNFSLAAHLQLGASNESRTLIGSMWGHAADLWDSEERSQFLLLLLRDQYDVFPALDIAAILFQLVTFDADGYRH